MGYLQRCLKVLMWCAFALMGWGVLSCEEFCEESNRTAMVVNFYASDTRAARTMDKMSVQGVDNKEMVYKEAKISVALCPLDPTTDITSFVFTNDTIADTITINYTRNPGFISSECGCVDYSDILEIQTTHHSIKEVEVTNPSVTTVSYRADVVNAENIRIYY